MKNGYRLKELIEASGTTQKKFAAEIGVATSTLNGYITSTREPDLEMVVQIAKKLRVSIDFLMNLCAENNEPLILSPKEDLLVTKFRNLNSAQQDISIDYLDFLTTRSFR